LTFTHELEGRIRVIACLDQQPTFIHDAVWPDYDGSQQELERLRNRLDCGGDDALIVVWGAAEDTVTAAEEIRLRYVDALDGVPHETRQPKPDGSTDFERILPGPDRMYPDTDSPPQAITAERVKRLQGYLPEPPWEREERYGKVGVPLTTIHFLIRRGGARLVDLVVGNCGSDLAWSCYFFGERLKGLRRSGVPVDRISDESWLALFNRFGEQPALRDAWKEIVSSLAESNDLDTALADLGLNDRFEDVPGSVRSTIETEPFQQPAHDNGQRNRFLMGCLMDGLRGLVPAVEVSSALAAELEARR
jgi:Glu-tRNA(Gln) amidotransferase subunit E-like FAD-binding protein